MRSAAAPRRALGRRRAPLGQPHDAAVAAEVRVAQLGVAVEAELADDGVLEGAGQEVGQEVGAGLLGRRGGDLVAREDVVAVLAAQALEPELVEAAVGAAVAVGEDDAVVAVAQVAGQPLDLLGDPLGAVVQQRGHGHDVDVPAAAPRDLADVDREGPARDDGGAHPGKASSSTKRSLKSARPESST